MKGIILAAGKGTRLYPITKGIPKPLLPVYDKPLIYYGIATLLLADIKEILIIVPPNATENFKKLLGDGKNWGIEISYKEQKEPKGIADALVIGEDFIGDDDVCLMLGDNIFYEKDLEKRLYKAFKNLNGAAVFGYYVDDPRSFGVVEFDENGKAFSIEEKPQNPKSNYIIPGLYFYNNDVIEIAKGIKPSLRGEFEITDVNIEYMNRGKLKVCVLPDDTLWLDAGSAESMLEAAMTVKNTQLKTGHLIGCPEAVAFRKKYINRLKLEKAGRELQSTLYGQYLLDLI